MKRCVAVSLVLMGGAALTACGGDTEVDTAVYNDVSQCISSGAFPADKCEADYKAAIASHVKTAPAYKSKADCEAEFGIGKCENNPAVANAADANTTASSQTAAAGASHSTGGFFMPMMMGYMMGSMMSGGQKVAPQALYQQRGRSNYVNANGSNVASRTGPVKFSSSSAAAKAPTTRTRTMARGGFGSRASAVS